jgi:alanyl-tRNA synthetase
LGFEELFLYKVADAVFDIFGEHYKELGERKGIIQETLKNEEALFRRTLNRGSELLSEFLEKVKTTLPGDIAFQLYDTFGFPLEVTQELCNEAGITVDLEGYKVAMAEAQDRSRGAQGDKSAYGDLIIDEELKIEGAPDSTDFLGYQHWSATGDVVRVRNLQEGHAKIALSVTPFYAESGGQTGDTGKLLIDGKAITVTNTTKSSGTFWHDIIGESVGDLLGKTVQAEIDSERRARIQRNHTATHLLQAALRQVLGNHVTQAGSYNGPENLRFDFTHGKGLTRAEIDQIEQIVNSEVLKNTPVTTYVDLPIDEARAKGAMALFGEKYGDRVRMVEIGEFSKELCGGTHVRTTGEIGSFRIVSESSAASGVRRIEAITGEAAYALAKEESERLKEAAGLLKSTPKDLIPAVEKVIEQLKEERKKREKAEMAALTGETTKSEVQDVQGIQLWVKNFGESDIKIATQSIDNEANGKANQVTLGVITGEKVTFVCKVGSEAVAKGAHAGNLLRELAKMTGGGGGGRADYATAGGKETSKVEQALNSVAELLKTQINS